MTPQNLIKQAVSYWEDRRYSRKEIAEMAMVSEKRLSQLVTGFRVSWNDAFKISEKLGFDISVSSTKDNIDIDWVGRDQDWSESGKVYADSFMSNKVVLHHLSEEISRCTDSIEVIVEMLKEGLFLEVRTEELTKVGRYQVVINQPPLHTPEGMVKYTWDFDIVSA